MRRVLLAVVAVALVAGAAFVRPDRLAGPALRLLVHVPADPGCTTVIGGLAALAQGLGPQPCALDTGAWSRAILVRLAHDRDRPTEARRAALAALGSDAPSSLAQALTDAPDTPPALRHDAAALVDPERLEGLALHGLHDRALARWFAAGDRFPAVVGLARAGAGDLEPELYAGLGVTRAQVEEGVARHARGQLPVGLPTTWWESFWRYDCRDGCSALLAALVAVEVGGDSDGPTQDLPGTPLHDLDLEVLDAVDGPDAADHVSAELGAIARWAGRDGGSRRRNRLVAAVAHPGARPMEAADVLVDGGRVHAVLRRGGGTPGATAWTLGALGLALGVPVSGWRTPDGVALLVGGRGLRLTPCGPAEPVNIDSSWPELPRDSAAALLLVEAAARALRAGEDPSDRLALARARWPEAPGLSAVEAAWLATRPLTWTPLPKKAPPPEQADVAGVHGVVVPGGLLVHHPVLGRRAVEPPDDRPLRRAALAERVATILAMTTGADRLRVAWWAAHAGQLDVARAVLAEVPVGTDPALRSAVLRRLGEPAGPASPESRGRIPVDESEATAQPSSSRGYPGSAEGFPEASGEKQSPASPVSAPQCPVSWAPEPPIWAWAG